MTADLLSFEAPFLIFCGLALALLFAALAALPREEPRTASAMPALPAVIRATRSGLGAWAAAIILGGALLLGLVEVVAPLDLDARLGLSSSAIGLLFAASIAVDAAVSPFGGRWGDRRGRRGPAIVGLAATGLSMVALAVLPGVGGTAVALGVYGAGFSLMMVAAVPWLDEAFPGRERGLATGSRTWSTRPVTRSGPSSAGCCSRPGTPISPTDWPRRRSASARSRSRSAAVGSPR